MFSTSGYIWLDTQVSKNEADFLEVISQHWVYREGLLFAVGHFDEWKIMHELRYILRFLHGKGRGEVHWKYSGKTFFALKLEGNNVVVDKPMKSVLYNLPTAGCQV